MTSNQPSEQNPQPALNLSSEAKAAAGPIEISLSDGRIVRVREVKPVTQNRIFAAAARLSGCGDGIAFESTVVEVLCRWAIDAIADARGKPERHKRTVIAGLGELMPEDVFNSLSDADVKVVMAAARRVVTDDDAKN